MRAGPLDRRIMVQAKTDAQDTFGADVETWTNFAIVWAGVRRLGATERFASPQVQAVQTAVFRIRHRADLTPSEATHRLLFEGKTWNITGVAELGRGEGWELTATATEG